MYNLRVLQREEDEDRRCHEDEEARQTPDVSIEYAGDVVDRGPYVGEDDGPAKEGVEPSLPLIISASSHCVCPAARR